jgi:uncharacterized protein YndB with AHSA1/START domain
VHPHAAPVAAAALRLAEKAEAAMEYGLDVRAQHTVKADVERTWSALLELAGWWPPCWPDGARLVFEPRVGGRLGTTFAPGSDQRFPDGEAGSLWGVVAELHPGRELAVDGTMGMRGPVVGRWRMTLEPDGPATGLTVEHRVLGQVSEDDRAGYSDGWRNVFANLEQHLEAIR